MEGRFSKHADYFGRKPDFIQSPLMGCVQEVAVARFPPVSAGFFRKFVTPAHEFCVYITDGMSQKVMQLPADAAEPRFSRIELCAYTTGAYIGAQDGSDMLSGCLQSLANYPFKSNTYFAPLHTASLERPLCPGSEMVSFLFAVPTGVNMRRLCSCTPNAELVVSVFPISSAECAYALKHGTFALLDKFSQNQIPVNFDLFRKSVI